MSLQISAIVPKDRKSDLRQYGKSMRKQNIPRSNILYIFPDKKNPSKSQNSKHGKSGFPQYGKSMRKQKYLKFVGFLNVSSQPEIHKIPKIWEKQIPIVRGKYGKTHFKVKGLLNVTYEAEIHALPKIWKKQIPIVWEKHGKTQTFQIYGFG